MKSKIKTKNQGLLIPPKSSTPNYLWRPDTKKHRIKEDTYKNYNPIMNINSSSQSELQPTPYVSMAIFKPIQSEQEPKLKSELLEQSTIELFQSKSPILSEPSTIGFFKTVKGFAVIGAVIGALGAGLAIGISPTIYSGVTVGLAFLFSSEFVISPVIAVSIAIVITSGLIAALAALVHHCIVLFIPQPCLSLEIDEGERIMLNRN